MIHHALIDAEGCVLAVWPGEAQPEGLGEGEVIPFDPWLSGPSVRWDGAAWVPRIDCPAELLPTGAEIWAPEGTAVEVWDIEADHRLATLAPDADYRVAIELPDPGRYRIEIEPIAPYLRSHLIVDVA